MKKKLWKPLMISLKNILCFSVHGERTGMTYNEFFSYPDEIRRVNYTINAIESLNASLRKVIKNRSAFPDDEAIIKIMYLAFKKASKKWTMPGDWL